MLFETGTQPAAGLTCATLRYYDRIVTCRQCGTEIADKALICYRCGAATTEPTFKPVAIRRSSPWWLIPLLVFLALATIAVLASLSTPDASHRVTLLGVAAAVVVVGIRAYVRRRR